MFAAETNNHLTSVIIAFKRFQSPANLVYRQPTTQPKPQRNEKDHLLSLSCRPESIKRFQVSASVYRPPWHV
ncbi:MAG: hypothetical protein JWQ27_2193 [Ferruginibacter sp.]|nr:hypothetical protein [Ferruginibacter sp.]